MPTAGLITAFSTSASPDAKQSQAGSYEAEECSCVSSLLPSRNVSFGEEGADSDAEAEHSLSVLSIDTVHGLLGSARYHTSSGAPKARVDARVAGTGLAPWEIHRPQKFVLRLVARHAFSGRVLDAGCGIGDNALYLAKACPEVEVTAVDVVPRCLSFVRAKAEIRGMQEKVQLVAASVTEAEPTRLPPPLCNEGCFDTVLDSSCFHCFGDEPRRRYLANLRRWLRPGGVLHLHCMHEDERRPGGARRVPLPELLSCFNTEAWWQVECVEDSTEELHPTFWGGQAKARLLTIRRL
ncbi:hypothetical protein HYH03_010190 [Edaphochlamys debaryana]|uniref:Methyltransferase domain-containing protein n=1 Tax=Edaphochlamys debaryana TaxID=47281 RepID=A0A835XX26_9CHLO|nr:hypothetical protein HYH03_010190 [Edaphochlamys debaryana]|eukprot:KAG2491399.1 hypothetical protein HYH03_010190 [Edaphochlamys debaryana]